MKMKPKVTAAITSLLPLLFISAIIAVDTPASVLTRSIPTQIASPIKNSLTKCDNYDTINAWFSKQLRLSHILQQNTLHLDTLLNETCDFYEKDAMQLLFDDVKNINQLNGSQSGEFPQSNGELGTDLDRILPWIRKLVHKGFKNHRCCGELEKSLNEIQKGLADKWNNPKNEIEESFKENAKIKGNLQEKQESLGHQLEAIKKRLEKIQQDNDNDGHNSNSRCCTKIDEKLSNVQNEFIKVNTEANNNTHKFGERLKIIQDKLKIQDKKATSARETLEKQGENIRKMLDKYENFKNSSKTRTKDSECPKGELDERILKLDSLIKERAYNIDNFGSLNHFNITICLQNSEKLTKIEYLLEKLLKDTNKLVNESYGKATCENKGVGNIGHSTRIENGGPGKEGSGNTGVGNGDPGKEGSGNTGVGNEKKGSGNAGTGNEGSGNRGSGNGTFGTNNPEDRIKKLQQEGESLRESIKISETCCEKTDHLFPLGDNLLKSTEHLNQTNEEHMNNSSLNLNEIKRLQKEAMDKLGSIKNNSHGPSDGTENDTGADFGKQLINLQSEIEKVKDDLKNLQNKFSNQVDKPTILDNQDVSSNLKEQMKKFNENWTKADYRLRQLEKRGATKPSKNNNKNLEKQIDLLHKDLNRTESEVARLGEHELFHKSHLEKVETLVKQITPCRDSCAELDKMNDLIDQIEDLEKFFRIKLGIPITKSLKKSTTKRPPRNSKSSEENVLIGGIDFVEQRTDKNIFPG